MEKLFILFLPITFMFVCSQANATNDKAELKEIAESSGKLAIIADECTESKDTASSSCKKFIKEFNKGSMNKQVKSFGKNIDKYIALDKDLTLSAVTSIGVISEALSLILSEKD
ncbi:hypothetical protein Q4520_20985 [Alteromonas sp. 1_MG-2023]|uniref:hypothetical protein n=1 Tax=Alteromonas sp. 1_MG-2023 TaxID=3062669 RepID=UPI0026E15B8D|nr:hypothetical protein [Alteromonas sp. 1_MG-2023]MDO6477904.1 hypothetical protein [Alteromonas sp. 1_MG-2023]